jgi:hypothetical protein
LKGRKNKKCTFLVSGTFVLNERMYLIAVLAYNKKTFFVS